MYTVASVLKQNREQKGFSLDEVAKTTKIPKKYLDAFESEKFKDYPSEPYCSLHVKNYARFLGLNEENILALFRRDYASFQKNQAMPKSLGRDILTPQRIFQAGVVLAIVFFVGYLLASYFKYNQSPSLAISWPQPNPANASVLIEGTTSQDATIRVNQELVIVTNGHFSKEVFLSQGQNQVTIESKGRNGKTTTASQVFLVP